MSTSNKSFSITEYGGFVNKGESRGGFIPLSADTFNALELFILANRAETEVGTTELLSLSVRRGGVKTITARNYVGVITTNDGTVIEILPKICNLADDADKKRTKEIFLEMLRALKDASFKHFNVSNLKTDRLSLFEIFIQMFADEVLALTKQGLKSAYTTVEANERFFKGKLNVAQDIRHNLVNRERFYVRYSVFSVDRAENRLIKATLRFLLKRTTSTQNRQKLSQLLAMFESVGDSTNVDADFSLCVPNRSMTHYEKALSWCRVFLKGNSFTPFAGSDVAMALLFPMEKVFESFIAAKIRKHKLNGWDVRTQDRKYWLFDEPRAFNLRPDIVLENDNEIIIVDTKWKLLSSDKSPSQSDMYQMYAYGKKYAVNGKKVSRIILLYPKSDMFSDSTLTFRATDGVDVEVRFIDLQTSDVGISALLNEVCV
jgi:5-methylcytosine-specific restriction enzyme subunit McrC